jgi:hypothetical protein
MDLFFILSVDNAQGDTNYQFWRRMKEDARANWYVSNAHSRGIFYNKLKLS